MKTKKFEKVMVHTDQQALKWARNQIPLLLKVLQSLSDAWNELGIGPITDQDYTTLRTQGMKRFKESFLEKSLCGMPLVQQKLLAGSAQKLLSEFEHKANDTGRRWMDVLFSPMYDVQIDREMFSFDSEGKPFFKPESDAILESRYYYYLEDPTEVELHERASAIVKALNDFSVWLESQGYNTKTSMFSVIGPDGYIIERELNVFETDPTILYGWRRDRSN